MTRHRSTASISKDGDWYVTQCLEVHVASQGEIEKEALFNVREALDLLFEPPVAEALPHLQAIEIEFGAA